MAGSQPSLPAFQLSFTYPKGEDPLRSVPSAEFTETSLKDISLLKIRKAGKISKNLKFTHDKQTVLDDQATFEYYLGISGQAAKLKTRTANPNGGGTSPGGNDANTSENAADIPTITIDLLSKTGKTAERKHTEVNQDLVKEINDLVELGKLVDAGKLQSIASKLGESDLLSTKAFAAVAGTGAVTEAADLTEQQWQNILLNNRILHGYNFDLTAKKEFLVKAPKRAFALRKPYFEEKPEAPKREGVTPENTDSWSSNDPRTERDYLESMPGLPPYYVHDDANVTVTEIQSAFQRQMCKEGFSSHAVTANAALPISSFATVDAAGAWSQSHSTQNQELESSKTSSLRVAYNFPRVVLEFLPEHLQLSDECWKDIQEVKNASVAQQETKRAAFWDKYGRAFNLRVMLGGYLHSDRNLTEKERGELQATKDETKWAAGGSIKTPYFSPGGNYSQTNSDTTKEEKSQIGRTGQLAWDAVGGDTTLCSNPPLWASTVKGYKYWRVMEQSVTCGMQQLMRAIEPNAVADLEYRKDGSVPPTDPKELARQQRRILTNRLSQLLEGEETSRPMEFLLHYYKEHSDDKGIQEYNSSLTAEKDQRFSINVGTVWGDLTGDQKLHYARFVHHSKKPLV